MGLHRLRRDLEAQRDLLIHVAARDVLEHLALACSERVQLRLRLGDTVEVEVDRVDAPRGRVDLIPAPSYS